MSERAFVPVRIAVLTVSDTRSLDEDRSGDVLVKRLQGAGHILADRGIVQDERAEISARLREWCARDDVDVILSTGGTGLTGRDVTVEAHRDGPVAALLMGLICLRFPARRGRVRTLGTRFWRNNWITGICLAIS